MDTCFLCGACDLSDSAKYESAITSKVPSSQKSVSAVLTHLANCIKTSINFKPSTKVCPRCFYELSDYDAIMVSLMTSQKKLANQLKAALKSDFKPQTRSRKQRKPADAESESGHDIIEKIVGGEAETEPVFVEIRGDLEGSLDIKPEYCDEEDEDCEADDDEFICEVEVPQTQTESGSGESEKEEEKQEKLSVQMPMPTSKRVKQECSSCGKIYSSKYQLQKHIADEHSKQNSHVCPICGIARRDEEYLELHMNVHEGKTEKQCRYCPKSFSRPVNTLRHMRMHWDKKKYQCEKCGLRFSQDNLLYNHRLRHEAEENPIICSICNVSFKSRKTFNHHTLIHKENRPRHYCTVCPKSFTERYTLKMHMKTHDSDVVFSSRDEPADDQQVVEEVQVDVDESQQAVTVIMSDDHDENSEFCLI